jgi:1-deoxy-D-xylulose-5-phosphate reductoisomerase
VPVVLNAANEVAVEAFLEGKLGFTAIPRVIEKAMNAHEIERVSTIDTVRRVDRWARQQAHDAARALELTV